MTWGRGNGGLGRKDVKADAPNPVPGRVTGVTGIRALTCGSGHVLAITAAGTLVAWGDDTHGEVGHGSPGPATVPGLKGVRSVSATSLRSAAILADGTIMVWGDVPTYARADEQSGNTGISHSPIPFVIKGLKNPR
jgi:alpha-tubulin suppressor-like RCC1 family protein